MADWLAATAPEGQAEERPDPGPFTTDISEGKSSPFYKAHSYPTKVPHVAIMRFLLHYTEPGDVVLDGFCGTGMTGVAAQACGSPDGDTKRKVEVEFKDRLPKWGARRAILSDLSPSATSIAAGLNLPIDARAFDVRSAEILDEFEADWGWMYETADDRGRKRHLDYTVWSEVFTCPTCAGSVVFYDVAFDPASGRVLDNFECPTCGQSLSKKTVLRRMSPTRSLAGDTRDRVEFAPVAIHYRDGTRKKSKAPDDDDLAIIRRIGGVSLPGPIPTDPLPIDRMVHGSRLAPKGFTHVHHLWGDRSLVALSALWMAASGEDDPSLRHALRFWIEQAFWGLSWMNRFVPVHYSHVNQFLSGVYYIPSQHAEYNPRQNLEGSQPSRGKRKSLVKTWEQSPARLGRTIINTGSSVELKLPDQSIDYVFVDPPFGANIPYSDLAIVTESWQGVYTDAAHEAVVGSAARFVRTLTEYGELMERCFSEFHRVLKPGRWMTVEFSNSSNEVWLTIQHALARAGFVVAETTIFDKEHLSYRQVTAKNVAKSDLIISAYKPADEMAERLEPTIGTPDSAWVFVREHLQHLPITMDRGPDGAGVVIRERMRDRLFDRMEAFHLQRNMKIPLTLAEFNQGLDERFPPRDGMHFLDVQLEAYDRQRMTIKELKAAQLFITDEDSAIQWLRQFLKSRRSPQPYSAIQPEFFREVQAGLPDWEEAPDLKELLAQSFVQDDEGRWYVPDPRKEADLEKLRKRSRLREFAGYAEGRGLLKHFSLATVRAGFSDAWERRDLEVIVAVGRRLPTEAFAQDERLLFYLDNAEQLVG